MLILIGLWRIWDVVGGEERRRGMRTPLSAGVLLVMIFLPYINIFGFFYGIWRTQAGLNRFWESE